MFLWDHKTEGMMHPMKQRNNKSSVSAVIHTINTARNDKNCARIDAKKYGNYCLLEGLFEHRIMLLWSMCVCMCASFNISIEFEGTTVTNKPQYIQTHVS